MPVPDVMWLNMTTRVRGVIAPANMETTPSGPFPSASSKCQFLYHHAMPLGAQPKTADAGHALLVQLHRAAGRVLDVR